MQFQLEFVEALPQVIQKPLDILTVLKANCKSSANHIKMAVWVPGIPVTPGAGRR